MIEVKTHHATAPAAGSSRARPRAAGRAIGWMLGVHPVGLVAATALVIRGAFALVSYLSTTGVLIPDEAQYISLASTVASGQSADDWTAGYGEKLYHSAWAFVAPLRLLFEVFTPSRAWGQLMAITFGVLTAVATTLLARMVVRDRAATLAGLAVAILPSQVLWSSVVLRESEVWFGLLLVAYGLSIAARLVSSSRWAGLVLAAGGLFLLGGLREQTMVVAAWATFVWAAVAIASRRWTVAAVAIVIALAVPWIIGSGPGGATLADSAAPALGRTRAVLSVDADSGFAPAATVVQPVEASSCSSGREHSGARGIAESMICRTSNGERVLVNQGREIAVDDSVGASIRHLPYGIAAFALRPLPWDQSTSVEVGYARVENVIWYVAYGLAALGLWVARRRLQSLVFPIALIGLVTVTSALTQGNVGTAFRHRGQLTWAFAVLGAAGIEGIVDHLRLRSTRLGGGATLVDRARPT